MSIVEQSLGKAHAGRGGRTVNTMPQSGQMTASYIDEDLVDLKGVWRGLRRRFGIFSGVALTATAAAAGYALLAPPLFTAQTTVVIEPTQNVVDDAAFTARGASARQLETHVELIRSRALAERVARRLTAADDGAMLVNDGDPSTDYIAAAIEKSAEQLKNDGAASVEGGASDLDPAASQNGGAQEVVSPSRVPTTQDPVAVDADFVRDIQKGFRVERVGLSNMIALRYTGPEPEAAAAISNAYAEEYIAQQIETRVGALRHANQWIEARLGVLRDEVRATEETTARFRVVNNLAEPAEGGSVVQTRIEEVVSKLTEERALLATYDARYQAVRGLRAERIPIDSIGEVMDSPLIRDLRNRQVALAQQEAEYSSLYKEKHPQHKRIKKEVAELEAQIDIEIGRIISSLRSEAAVTESRIQTLEGVLSDLQREAADLSPVQVRLQELERETEASRDRYEALLNRLKELHEREGLIEADARIVSFAQAPVGPSQPKRKLIMVGGAVMGLIAAGVVAFLFEI